MHPPESSFIFFYVTDTLLWLLRVMNTSTSFELYLDCFSLFSFYSGFSGSWMPPPALSFILTAFRFFLFTLVSHARECLHQLRDLSWFLFAPFFLLWILMLVNSPTSFSFYLDSFWLLSFARPFVFGVTVGVPPIWFVHCLIVLEFFRASHNDQNTDPAHLFVSITECSINI